MEKFFSFLLEHQAKQHETRYKAMQELQKDRIGFVEYLNRLKFVEVLCIETAK
jgi:hypothetical protein